MPEDFHEPMPNALKDERAARGAAATVSKSWRSGAGPPCRYLVPNKVAICRNRILEKTVLATTADMTRHAVNHRII